MILASMRGVMAQPVVRGIDGGIVQALNKPTGAHGRSAGADHRAILAAEMMTPPRCHLVELVGSIADVGLDSDFES